ncbi:MAG: GT4 family glycosyltransferase PelF [Oscillospiraceae bacterium]|nr:GT4 family glycosyltransferase PelF [Oscillospiraceae bacterium]MDD4414202.1 GT4 family glycosyltransferase PelF [Oscillospiraceae bacterium]
MRICMILEGCYPYVRGGLSSWMHSYILAMPQHEFVLWIIGAESSQKGKYKYVLPANVVQIHEVFLDDALNLPVRKKEKLDFNEREIKAHRDIISCKSPDWDILFEIYNVRKINMHTYLMSENFLDCILDMCRSEYPYISFAELFHTVRSMLLPMFYLMSQEIPEADIYHSTATGYGALLGAMAGSLKHKPFMITEHGIYSREREEELLRASWVPQYFKKMWIAMFYMLARAGYDRAVSVTALYKRANDIQTDLGCDKSKLKVISNGIKIEQFENIPLKKPNQWVDIGAIVRIHPIKDIKTMIYSFFELKARVPNARLHILGDTDDQEYYNECVSLIEQLNLKDIALVGNVDVVKYIEQLDFTILTSISEAQPLSVLESLAAGRPCVTTDVGCCREILEGEGFDRLGNAGVCVLPMHPQAIASAMEFLCTRDNARAQMGQIGKKRMKNHFTHKRMVDDYLDNYKEVFRKWPVSGLN